MNFLTAQTFHKIMAAVRSTEEQVYLLSQSINYNNIIDDTYNNVEFSWFCFFPIFLHKIKL